VIRGYWKRLREALPRVSGEKKAGSASWTRRLGGLLIFLVAFGSGFWMALPEQLLLQRGRAALYQASGLVLTAQSMEIGFPLELQFSQCRLEALSIPVPLRLESLRLSPRWRSLLLGNPAIEVEAIGYGGSLTGQMGSDGYLEVAVRDLDLTRFEGLPGGYRLEGRLRATAQGEIASREGVAWQLQLTGLGLTGLQSFGIEQALMLGRAESRGHVQGQTFKVEALQLDQGVLEASGDGSVILGRDPASSRIAASLKVRAGKDLPAFLGDLLALSGQSPDAEGWRTFRLSGRLDAPRIQ